MVGKKIVCILGTRPEAVKMAPVIIALRKARWAEVCVVATAQHRKMLDMTLQLFNIKPDIDLNIMQKNQGLLKLTTRILTALDKTHVIKDADAIIAQGDTTTVMAAALHCFYKKIPFFHVESGLRSQDLNSPYPEEMNRIVADRLSTLCFAPTKIAKHNLIKEGISSRLIKLTGNTIVDALHYIQKKHNLQRIKHDPTKRLILVTAHRRESFGKPFLGICKALRMIADQFLDVEILYPVHLNPNINKIAYKELSNHPRIKLCAPLNYIEFVSAMYQSYLILTDSGGVQEEAPVFGKPILVLRENTERPEGVDMGIAKLVGTKTKNIVKETSSLLTDTKKYKAIAKAKSPYGDGLAAQRIVSIIKKFFINQQ